MKIRTQQKKKSPILVVEFDSPKEQADFVAFGEGLAYDDTPKFESITGYPVFGVDSDAFMAFICAHQESKNIGILGTQGEPFAVWWNIDEIKTDPKRFQNRTNAFSELSAEQVAKNYDENKLDPIIVWRDPENQKIYVLSGHSRYEGMRRRAEQYIPVRFFTGSQGDAIKFARIDANRAANKENLIEDLTAYKLSKFGDASKGITPMEPKELKQAFKGKEGKLEAWSYLSPTGKFLQALSDEDSISQFPRVQSFATWAGKLRKEKENITDLMENDMFNFFFHSDRGGKITFEKFRNKVIERLGFGKDRLFPECEEIPCKVIKDFKEVGQNRDVYKELAKLNNLLLQLQERNETDSPVLRIYTEEEKKALASVKKQINETVKRLQRDLKILENTPGLFGIDENKELMRIAIQALSQIK